MSAEHTPESSCQYQASGNTKLNITQMLYAYPGYRAKQQNNEALPPIVQKALQ